MSVKSKDILKCIRGEKSMKVTFVFYVDTEPSFEKKIHNFL